MESRKVKGWRSRLEEQIDEAMQDLWEYGAEKTSSRRAGQELDFRETKQAKDKPFERRDSEGGLRRRASCSNKEAKQRIKDLRQELANREGIKSVQYERRKRWIASMTAEQLAQFKEKDRLWRKAYRDRLNADPVRRQREQELAKVRRKRRDPALDAEYKRIRRMERTDEQRAIDAAAARAWREKNKDKVREYKRRERERKKALRNA